MELYYPYVSDRYKSTFIDTLVVVGLMAFFSFALNLFGDVPDSVRIVCFVLLFLYEPVCISFFGGSIGNISNQLRVRNSSNPTKRLNFFLAIIRTFFKYGMGIISLLIIHMNPERKAIHDFLSGSIVISLNPAYASEEIKEETPPEEHPLEPEQL